MHFCPQLSTALRPGEGEEGVPGKGWQRAVYYSIQFPRKCTVIGKEAASWAVQFL